MASYAPLHLAAPLRDPRRRTAGHVGLAALLLVVVLRSTVVTPVRIDSGSMLPTLAEGDVVLLDQRVQPDDLARGDLLAFARPTDGRHTIKRLVGLPGETLVVKDSVLHVDGTALEEPYVDHAAIDGYYSRTFEVPAGSVFVLGDHRGNSVDSRDYGPVEVGQVQARVLLRVWPPVRTGGPSGRPPKQ